MGSTKKSLMAIFAAAAVLAAVSTVSSCEKYVLPSLSLSQDTVLVNKAAQELELVVNTNVDWHINMDDVDAEWIHFSIYAGYGTATVQLTIDENDSGAKRRVTIPVETGTLRRKLMITQSADGELPTP
jgi:hypothetical protein